MTVLGKHRRLRERELMAHKGKLEVTDTRTAVDPKRDSFLPAGVRELGRKIARFKLRRSMRQRDLERAAAHDGNCRRNSAGDSNCSLSARFS